MRKQIEVYEGTVNENWMGISCIEDDYLSSIVENIENNMGKHVRITIEVMEEK